MSVLLSTYSDLGWQMVRLYGVASPQVCTCWKGKDCATPGKHPCGESWHMRTTNDDEEIAEWIENGNVGLLLGPRSGVIDVELDGDDAKQAWESLGLGEIWTPTYTAGRGPHRLFKWTEGLPEVAVRKVLGIEVRIGNGDRACQSVLPPSTHHTGVKYNWVEGMSPADIELAELPEKLVNMLWNDDGSTSAITSRRSTRLALHNPIASGERNNETYRFAVREAFRSMDLDHADEQQDLLQKIRMVNQLNCKPPMNDDEVASIFRSAIGYVRKARAAGIDQGVAIEQAERPPEVQSSTNSTTQQNWQRLFTECGLAHSPLVPGADSDPEWGPGEWQLTVVHSDPLEYKLHVPAWKQYTSNHTGNVSLTVDQYRSAAKVAASVLASTGVIMLDDEPGKWKRIWDGGYRVEDHKNSQNPRKRVARGVKAKLLDNVQHEYPGASSKRYVILAGWLYDRLAQASQPSDDDIPDPTGRAAWRTDGTLWFGWSKVWEDIDRQHRVHEGERLSFKRRMLAILEQGDFKHAEFRHLGGTRRSYVVWSREDFAALERLANEST